MHIRALLDNALGPQGYYGVFTTNMHTDHSVHAGANAIVAEAQARSVPVVTARQMLDWLDGRNASSFEDMSYTGNQLRFRIDQAPRARGLTAMVPVDIANGSLQSLTLNGAGVTTERQLVKGIRYDTFPAQPGQYVATYAVDSTAPVISGLTATARDDGTATIAWQTNEASSTRVDYGLSAGALTSQVSDPALVTSHSASLNGLTPGRTYHFRVSPADDARNTATSPAPPAAPATFSTPAFLLDSSVADFSAGTRASTYAGASGAAQDGEVQLQPTVGEEWGGPVLPADWTVTPWATGGTGLIADSALTVDGARAGTTPAYPPDRSVEFVAGSDGVPARGPGRGPEQRAVDDLQHGRRVTGHGPVGALERRREHEHPGPGRADDGAAPLPDRLDGLHRAVLRGRSPGGNARASDDDADEAAGERPEHGRRERG
jgi:hypothetical protein